MPGMGGAHGSDRIGQIAGRQPVHHLPPNQAAPTAIGSGARRSPGNQQDDPQALIPCRPDFLADPLMGTIQRQAVKIHHPVGNQPPASQPPVPAAVQRRLLQRRRKPGGTANSLHGRRRPGRQRLCRRIG